MEKRIIPLIMCGGAGTRLWPASREGRPKQFLPLFGARSTFQDTLKRVSDATLFERPIVITNATYRFMVLEQLAEIGIAADVLLEPMRRDSGPANRSMNRRRRSVRKRSRQRLEVPQGRLLRRPQAPRREPLEDRGDAGFGLASLP
jgi:Nucleotidyl transferase